MSFAETKAYGNGILEFRLEIEGFDFQFGSHSAMDKTTSQFEVLGGTLLREDLTINYDLDYLNSVINANSISFRLIDKQGRVTEALCRIPTKTTLLTANAEVNDTTFFVGSTSGWTNGETFFIGTEAIQIGTVNSGDGKFETCVRGQLSSSAYKHVIATSYGHPLNPFITDIPLNLKGRKVSLYAYGKHDDFQGQGTQIWRGILDYEFSLQDGTTYVLNAYPITELFKSKVGEGLQNFPIRGIYHPDDYPLQIVVTQRQDNILEIPIPFNTFTIQTIVSASGFYATIEDLIGTLNTQLDNASGWPHKPSFILADSGELALTYTLPTGDNKAIVAWTYPAISAEYPIDFETFDNKFWEINFAQTPNVEIETTRSQVGKTYIQKCKTIALDRFTIFYANSPSLTTATNPATTMYIDTNYFPSSINSTRLVSEDFGSIGLQNYTIDNTNGRFTNIRLSPSLPRGSEGLGFTRPFIIQGEDWTFQIGVRLLESGSFGRFFSKLIEVSPTYFGEGLFPIISNADVDTNDINRQLLRYQGGPYFSERNFEYYKGGKTLEEIISEECKLNGFQPSFTSEGKFTIKRFKPNSVTDPSTYSAGHSEIGSIPSLDKGDENIKNNAILYLDYDPIKDEYNDKVQAKYNQSVIYTGLTEDWEVKPTSIPTRPISESEIRRIIISPIYLFGTPATKISFDIPFKLYGIAPGDSIAVSSVLIPNFNSSKRGVENLVCVVTSVSFNLDSGIGSVTALYFGDFAGYTPSCEIISGSFQGSNTWNLHVSGNYYSMSGNIDSNFFEVGMEVEATRYGSWTPSRVSGSITAIPSNNFITVQFDSNNAALSGTIFSGTILRFQNRNNLGSDSPGLEQKKYAFISSGSNVGNGGAVYDTWTSEFGV